MIYYIADCHFFHNALNEKMDKRGFKSCEEMNEYMIEKWNSKVTRADTVVILGDLSLGKAEETNELIHRLKGKLCLITGNHDKFVTSPDFDRDRFEWIDNYRVRRRLYAAIIPFLFMMGSTGKDITAILRLICSMDTFMRPGMKCL